MDSLTSMAPNALHEEGLALASSLKAHALLLQGQQSSSARRRSRRKRKKKGMNEDSPHNHSRRDSDMTSETGASCFFIFVACNSRRAQAGRPACFFLCVLFSLLQNTALHKTHLRRRAALRPARAGSDSSFMSSATDCSELSLTSSASLVLNDGISYGKLFNRLT
jgi:hypothetical protein